MFRLDARVKTLDGLASKPACVYNILWIDAERINQIHGKVLDMYYLEYPPEPAPTLCARRRDLMRSALGFFFGVEILR